MFKVLVLQTLYNRLDEQMEYQIRDRLSFMKFLELEMCDDVPGARTVWLFREPLRKTGAVEDIFSRFGSTSAPTPADGAAHNTAPPSWF